MTDAVAVDEELPLLTSTKIPQRRLIIVEPVVLLWAMVLFGLNLVSSQYIFVEIGKQYNYTQAGIGNHDNKSCHQNHSDPTYILQQKVEAESTQFTLYSTALTAGPAIISSLYLGGYTDKRGRRLGIILPLFGGVIQSLSYVFVIYFEASIYYLLIGSFLTGVCGYFTVFLMSVFAYIADITTHKTRSRRIVLVEMLATIGAFISNFGLGFMLSAVGFLWPAIILSALMCIAFVYALFFIPETVIPAQNSSINVLAILKNGLQVFTNNSKQRQPTRLLILLAALCCFFLVTVAGSGAQTLYMMDSPLCFTSTELGLVGALTCVTVTVGVALGIFLFMKLLKLKDTTVSIIGCCSYMIRYVAFGLSRSPKGVFLSMGAGLFEFLAAPLLRSAMSKAVAPGEQGSLFSAIAFVEGTCQFAGNFIWNSIYESTLNFYNGTVFFTMGATVFMAAMLILIHKCIFHDTLPQDEENEKISHVQ